VLVIDPDAGRAQVLVQALQGGGAEVTVAPSGSFALTMLEYNRHDVVLSRARIGDMDGHELCGILKADPGMRDVRFVLVAAPDEIPGTATTTAGVDLVLPPALTGSGIVPLILRLVRDNRPPQAAAAPPVAPAALTTAAAAVPASPVAAAPAPSAPAASAPPPLPRLRPEAPPPPATEPPKRYMTAATAAAAAPWSKTGAPEPVEPPPPLAPAPPITPPPPAPAPSITPPPITPAPVGSVPSVAQAPVSVPASPVPPRPPAPAASPKAPPAAGPAGRPVPAPAELRAIPSGTFQGSLEVMELADLTQAIAAGGKTGRLILALAQGGGVLLFDKGRVVHAEYRNAVGEEAFGALLAACHGDGAGRFCFLPSPAGQSSGMPRTIDKTVDRLLLSSATAIDEKG
jgi:CheY-like chemotaxis protein